MINTNQISILADLKAPSPLAPWKISPELLKRMENKTSKEFCQSVELIQTRYNKIELLPDHPYFQAINRLFNAQKVKRLIAKIYVIYNKTQEESFEAHLFSLEEKMSKRKSTKDNDFDHSEEVMERLETLASSFSPFRLKRGNIEQKFVHTKVLPLWYGDSGERLNSICSSGLRVSSKHSNLEEEIYLATSASYAAGKDHRHLLLVWAPIQEMIPVNINTQEHSIDGIMISQPKQALARFWVVMQPDLTEPVPGSSLTVGSLLELFSACLKERTVKENQGLSNCLENKRQMLASLKPEEVLSPENIAFYHYVSYRLKLIHTKQATRDQAKQKHTLTISNENAPISSHQCKTTSSLNKGCAKNHERHTQSIIDFIQLDNQNLISCSFDKTLRLWDIKKAKNLQVFQGHKEWVSCMLVLEDHQTCLSGSWDKSIRQWDLKSGECSYIFKGHTDSIHTLIPIKDHTFASGSYDRTIRIWDFKEYKCISTLQGHTEAVHHLIELEKKQLASGSLDGTIKIWDLNNNQCVQTLKGHFNGVRSLIKLSDGKLASSSDERLIKIWDIKSGKCIQELQGDGNTTGLLLELKNGKLVSSYDNGTIRIWDITRNQYQEFKRQGRIKALLELSNGRLASGDDQGTIQLLDITNGEYKVLKGHKKEIIRLIELKGNQKFASCSHDATIKTWDLKSGVCIQTL